MTSGKSNGVSGWRTAPSRVGPYILMIGPSGRTAVTVRDSNQRFARCPGVHGWAELDWAQLFTAAHKPAVNLGTLTLPVSSHLSFVSSRAKRFLEAGERWLLPVPNFVRMNSVCLLG